MNNVLLLLPRPVESGDVALEFEPRAGRGAQGGRGAARGGQRWRPCRFGLVVDRHSDDHANAIREASGLTVTQPTGRTFFFAPQHLAKCPTQLLLSAPSFLSISFCLCQSNPIILPLLIFFPLPRNERQAPRLPACVVRPGMRQYAVTSQCEGGTVGEPFAFPLPRDVSSNN